MRELFHIKGFSALLLGFPGGSVGLQCRRPWFDFWVRKIPWRRDRLPTPVFLGFPCGSAGKESTLNVEDLGLIPGLGRSPGEGIGYPLQYSGLENSPWGGKESDKTEQLSLSHGKEIFFCQRATASTLFPLLKDLAPSVTTHTRLFSYSNVYAYEYSHVSLTFKNYV